MLVNRNAISTLVLQSTLQEEVNRLRKMCSDANFKILLQKIKSTEYQCWQLQRNHTMKSKQRDEIQEGKLKSLKQLIQVGKHEETKLSRARKINQQLLSQLHKIRNQARQIQKQLKFQEKQSSTLSADYQTLEQKLNMLMLRNQDTQQALAHSYRFAGACKEKINQTRRNLTLYQDDINIEKLLVKNVQSQIKEIQQEIQSQRLKLLRVVEQVTQQKNDFIKVREAYAEEETFVQTEKDLKVQTVAQLEEKIMSTAFQEKEVNSKISALNLTTTNIESKLVNNLNTCQSIQSSIFDLKIARTATKSKHSSLTNKLSLLKESKQKLLSLISAL